MSNNWLKLRVWPNNKDVSEYDALFNMDLVKQIRPFGPDPNKSLVAFNDMDNLNVYVKHSLAELYSMLRPNHYVETLSQGKPKFEIIPTTTKEETKEPKAPKPSKGGTTSESIQQG